MIDTKAILEMCRAVDPGPWWTDVNGEYIHSDDFKNDGSLRIVGDFDVGGRRSYANALVALLNSCADVEQLATAVEEIACLVDEILDGEVRGTDLRMWRRKWFGAQKVD